MINTMHRTLLVIACLLSINFVFRQVIPPLIAQANRKSFELLVVKCEKARESAEQARRTSFDDELTKEIVEKSAYVELLSCVDRDILKDKLLAWGVSPSLLHAIKLEALMQHPDIAASSLTQEYAK